jgi:hypothetical protein
VIGSTIHGRHSPAPGDGAGRAFSLSPELQRGAPLLADRTCFRKTRWKRPVHRRTAPPETVGGATVAAIRYVRYAPEIRALMLRSGVVMFFASAPFALLPTVAHSVSNSGETP